MFNQKEISFLGFIIIAGSYRVNLDSFNSAKLEKIPKSLEESRPLIGYLNSFRSFIPNLTGLMAPLTEKLKDPKFRWFESDTKLVKKIENENF